MGLSCGMLSLLGLSSGMLSSRLSRLSSGLLCRGLSSGILSKGVVIWDVNKCGVVI
jgi:hypothetical protein